MNKNILPSALSDSYLNYFIHGVGCSIFRTGSDQGSTAASWGVRLWQLQPFLRHLTGRLDRTSPFAGPLSDKLGRRISTVIGSGSGAIYLIDLRLHLPQEQMADIRSHISVPSSEVLPTFPLDTGIYPAVGEIIYKAPGVANDGN